ncbi:MAG: sodium:proton antiporter [Pseudomonadota bacterium]|nr:sodium:proton antiporter [Pseudomonadota bacterium]
MNLLSITAAMVSLAALFAYLNDRILKLPTTIGVMLLSLLFSLALLLLDAIGFGLADRAVAIVRRIDFNETLMEWMLSFLLFAGALHVNLEELWRHKWTIGGFATLGVLLSTLLVATFSYIVLDAIGFEVSFIYCLLFGALISPTDPIAVLGILKRVGAPRDVEVNISGESLFNDGVGVVVFMVILGVIASGQEPDPGHIATLFAEEAFGGIVLGLVLGFLAYRLIRRVDNYQVEVLLTLALVMGGYTLAMAIHVSGPIVVVVAGLLIGNRGRMLAMSERSREHLDTFWELVDEILNVVLFVLIGLELLVIQLSGAYLLASLLIIPVVLLARWVSVGTLVNLLRPLHDLGRCAVPILTWGGLRGGISVALALSIPAGPERDLLLTITYCVVLFSIVVQGLSVGRLVQALNRPERE